MYYERPSKVHIEFEDELQGMDVLDHGKEGRNAKHIRGNFSVDKIKSKEKASLLEHKYK